MEGFISAAETVVRIQQSNVKAAHDHDIGPFTPYQKALLSLSDRAKQDSRITPKIIADSTTITRKNNTLERVYEFGPDDMFNPLAMLEIDSCVINGVPQSNWKILLHDSIDLVLRTTNSPMEIVVRIFECWHSQFMPQLVASRGTSTSLHPSMLIRHPIWTIRSIVAHMYYNWSSGSKNRFAELLDQQLQAAILDTTRKRMTDADYKATPVDVAMLRLNKNR